MSDYQPFVTDTFKRLMTLMEETEEAWRFLARSRPVVGQLE